MFKFFVLLTLNLCLADHFDPTKIDYCSMACQSSGEISSGCYCDKASDRDDMTQNIEEFRKIIIEYHNQLRNRIARGDEPPYPPAANMQVLNYDLELEYIARCYLLTRFENYHDKCRTASFCDLSNAGQNLAGTSDPSNSFDIVKSQIQSWYDEHSLISPESVPNLLNSFSGGPWGHFTQVVWATMTRVGCAWVKIPNNPEEVWKYTLACNYASDGSPCSGNVLTYTVYEIGDKCSKCGDKKCNNELGGEYDALCGSVKQGNMGSWNQDESQGSITDSKNETKRNIIEKKTEIKNTGLSISVNFFVIFLSLFVAFSNILN